MSSAHRTRTKGFAGSAGPLSWKERDRVRCVTSPEMDHTSPQPSPSRRGSSGAPYACTGAELSTLRMRPGHHVRQDGFQYAVKIVPDVRVADADYVKPGGLYDARSLGITIQRGRVRMGRSIDLHDQLRLQADEIGDEAIDRMLPAEFPATQAAAPKSRPELGFGGRRVHSKCARSAHRLTSCARESEAPRLRRMSGILYQMDVPSAYRHHQGDIALRNSAGSAGPLSCKERDRVRWVTSPEVDHTSPCPSSTSSGRFGAGQSAEGIRRGSRSARCSR